MRMAPGLAMLRCLDADGVSALGLMLWGLLLGVFSGGVVKGLILACDCMLFGFVLVVKSRSIQCHGTDESKTATIRRCSFW